MNTTRTGMRAILATAAAGALIIGSAAGAMAAPKEKSTPKAGYMQLRMVNVHNGFINVNPAAVARDLKIKANVWDTVKGSNPTSVTVTLAQYDMKGTPTTATPPKFAEVVVPLDLTSKRTKKSKNYSGVLRGTAIVTALTDPSTGVVKVAPTETVLVCLKAATLAGDNAKENPKRQVTKKLGTDCVRIVNVDPASTASDSDDKD